MSDLKECPFCGANVFVKSNRYWHRLDGTHLLNCPFYDSEYPAIVPATDEGLEELLYTWNTRTSPAAPSKEVVEAIGILQPLVDRWEFDSEITCAIKELIKAAQKGGG